MGIKLFQLCATFTPYVLTGSHVVRCFIQRCLPYAPGFEFLGSCEELSKSDKHFHLYLPQPISLVYWVAINLVYVVTFVKLGEGFFFVTIQLYFVQSCCIRYYLSTMLANMSKTSKFRKTTTIIKLYKQLQLILRYYNQLHQDIFVIVLLHLVGLCIIIGLFAVISSWNIITNVQCLVLTASALQAIFGLMILFGNFAGIYEDSLSFIANLRLPRTNTASTISGNEKHSLEKNRKIAKSLFPLKVRIGSVNFVDRFTPITFIDFCFGIVVNMLLLK